MVRDWVGAEGRSGCGQVQVQYPEHFRYTKEHQWVEAAGGVATIGITHHAQEQLGDIVYVDLPKPGAAIAQGETFGSVESAKAVSDIFAPVSGEVTEVNPVLAESPEILNQDPHGTWLIRVRLAKPEQLAGLLSAAEYQRHVEAE
jgi:glycine cleavage system H protein